MIMNSRERAHRYTHQQASELVVTQRAALVTFHILGGGRLTTQEIATMVGVTTKGALRMMEKISAVVPVFDDDDGVWQRVERTNE